MEGGPRALPCFNMFQSGFSNVGNISHMMDRGHGEFLLGTSWDFIVSFRFLLVKPIFCPPAQYQPQSAQNMQILNWSNANFFTPRLLRFPTNPPTRSLASPRAATHHRSSSHRYQDHPQLLAERFVLVLPQGAANS